MSIRNKNENMLITECSLGGLGMNIRTVREAELCGKRVLVRVAHYPVPVGTGGGRHLDEPMFEQDRFARGSEAVARALTRPGIISVVGGGDSLAVLDKIGLTDKVTHASTGGGASLEFLEGKTLPGIAILTK